jgi:hypothetical protein
MDAIATFIWITYIPPNTHVGTVDFGVGEFFLENEIIGPECVITYTGLVMEGKWKEGGKGDEG